MLNQLLQKGEEDAQKGETNYKHVCYIVRNKTILTCEVNKYGTETCGRQSTYHAEECALLHNQHPKLREPSRRKRHTKAQGQRRFSSFASKPEARTKERSKDKVLQEPQRVLCGGGPLCIPIQANAGRRMGSPQLQTMC